MSEILDDVKDNVKKLPKWAWIAIGGGFLLVAFLANKKPSYVSAPVYDEIPSGDKPSESDQASQFNSIINGLEQSFAEQFKEQGDYFNQALTEREQAHKDEMTAMNQSWESRVNGLTSSFTEYQTATTNQLSDLSSQIQPVPTAPVVPSSSIFKTGTFNNQADAERIASIVSKTYGGKNTQVVNEGGIFRVVSEFTDQDRANKVLGRMTDRDLIGIGYVK